jgi:hypothetical protein
MFDIGSSEGEIRSRKENKSCILNSPRRLNEIMENGLIAYFEPTTDHHQLPPRLRTFQLTEAWKPESNSACDSKDEQ